MLARPASASIRLKQQIHNSQVNTVKKKVEKAIPTKEQLIKERDFVSAITLLEYEKM